MNAGKSSVCRGELVGVGCVCYCLEASVVVLAQSERPPLNLHSNPLVPGHAAWPPHRFVSLSVMVK